MEPSNLYLELVRDALYARHMKHVGCFVFNQSSDQVQQMGTQILPTLERVLREEVMSECLSNEKAQSQFPGMANLLVDYFRIVKDAEMERAGAFLSSLRGPPLIEAIRAIGIIWDHTIPAAFMTAIETAAQTGSPEEREIASWLLNWQAEADRRGHKGL